MGDVFTFLGWFMLGLFGYVLLCLIFRALFPRRCPECRHGKLSFAGSARYTCRDLSGRKGGSYSILECRNCSRSFLDRGGKLKLLEGDDSADLAHRIVFGEPLSEPPPSHDMP
jgi:hypothetical protein